MRHSASQSDSSYSSGSGRGGGGGKLVASHTSHASGSSLAASGGGSQNSSTKRRSGPSRSRPRSAAPRARPRTRGGVYVADGALRTGQSLLASALGRLGGACFFPTLYSFFVFYPLPNFFEASFYFIFFHSRFCARGSIGMPASAPSLRCAVVRERRRVLPYLTSSFPKRKHFLRSPPSSRQAP
ncbi:hypothetical protein DFH06DRAFT_260232 [Mycena polygramma]|nr:hypothetical protein DFH06DRAFT_260232 [Mycena polygramma]